MNLRQTVAIFANCTFLQFFRALCVSATTTVLPLPYQAPSVPKIPTTTTSSVPYKLPISTGIGTSSYQIDPIMKVTHQENPPTRNTALG